MITWIFEHGYLCVGIFLVVSWLMNKGVKAEEQEKRALEAKRHAELVEAAKGKQK